MIAQSVYTAQEIEEELSKRCPCCGRSSYYANHAECDPKNPEDAEPGEWQAP